MMDLSRYLVTDGRQATSAGHDIVDVVLEAVAGGVTAVQVREKHEDARHTLQLVETLAERLPSTVSLFVNDRVDVFLAARAHAARVTGVHVGQRDSPVADVRALIGPEPVIGLTANTLAEIQAADTSTARVDYVGIGTVRETSSKPDAPAPLGVAGVVELAAQCALPAVAIGGILPADLPGLRAGNLAGAAVVSWVCSAADPRKAAEELTHAWKDQS